MSAMESIFWDSSALSLLDQRLLPLEHDLVRCETPEAVADAIRVMVVRGAPAIGIAAAYGFVLGVRAGRTRAELYQLLLQARPTAVNLRAALDVMIGVPDTDLEQAAVALHAEDRAINEALGRAGAPLLRGGILTICNTGTLATGGHGTALGVIRSAHALHGDLEVFALETRPWMQGARLTTTECQADGIPCTLLVDGAAGALMASGRVSAVIVGCDRVARNGDTANKIGTYGLAVLAHHHGLPFYVAMPGATYDPLCPDGSAIPIELRDGDEVRWLGSRQLAPSEVAVWNPSFDCTPAGLVTAWISERGVHADPDALWVAWGATPTQRD
jgi:methylthioribose-1-phosphate isomerase